jgi:branched-chain amino acid transport system permease protein
MLNFYVFPQIGPFFLLTALVIIVLGGIGSFVGALIGSFIIGISEALSGALLNIEFAKCISLAIFILILLFRPSGIISVEKSRV